MKALSVRQPWAGAILTRGKSPENRSKPTKHRGPLLIHAPQTVEGSWAFDAVAEFSHGQEVPVLGAPRAGVAWEVGALVGVVDVVGCHPASSCDTGDGLCTLWAQAGQFHWELADPRTFVKPIWCMGRLGLWTPDDHTMRKVREVLGGR